MIKQILFIIIATTAIQSTRTPNRKMADKDLKPREMANRELKPQEQTKFLDYINEMSKRNFRMTKSNVKLILDLKFQFSSVKAGFEKTATKEKYTFTIEDDEKSCDFNFSIYSSENFINSKGFKEDVLKCVPFVEEPVEDDSSEAHDLNEGTWIPETLNNSPMNQDQTKLMLKILNLENFVTENHFEYKEGVYHTDVLLENENKKRNTFRLTLVKEDITCNFLIHDNENNKNTLSNDVKAQLRTCGVKNTKASFHQQLKNAIGKKFGNKVHDETSESSDDFERKSSSSEAEKEYPEIAKFLNDLEDTYETKAVEIENNTNIIDAQKPEFIAKLEEIMANKVKMYEDSLIVKEDENIAVLENQIHDIKEKQNEVIEELDNHVVVDDHSPKNPDFLKKLSDIYQARAEKVQKDLNDEKRARDEIKNKMKLVIEEMMVKTQKKISVEEKEIQNVQIQPVTEVLNYNKELNEEMSFSSEEENIPIIQDDELLILPAVVNNRKTRSQRSTSTSNNKLPKLSLSSEENLANTDENNDIQLKSIDIAQKLKDINNQLVKDKLNKHFLQQILINGAPEKCSSKTRLVIKQLFTTLALRNQFQAIHLYDENFLDCTSQVVSGMKYTAIMSFNDEKCMVSLWSQVWNKEQPVRILYNDVKENGVLSHVSGEEFIVKGEVLPNCADRVGTHELKDFIAQNRN